MASNSAILTEAHFQNLQNALDQGTAIQREIDLAKQAGLDVAQAQAVLTESLGKIRQIKQTYFPGR
jgi:hypothetical protein